MWDNVWTKWTIVLHIQPHECNAWVIYSNVSDWTKWKNEWNTCCIRLLELNERTMWVNERTMNLLVKPWNYWWMSVRKCYIFLSFSSTFWILAKIWDQKCYIFWPKCYIFHSFSCFFLRKCRQLGPNHCEQWHIACAKWHIGQFQQPSRVYNSIFIHAYRRSRVSCYWGLGIG